ncbi:MAG: 50S ribosomal protein L25 [Thermoanaerobaculia bacterium]|nr:50S ribosomal protein L25 [Thermoanaerobaculia bacterium]
MSDLTLEVQSREAGGKNVNRRLRSAGKLPAVVYGGKLPPKNIEVDERSMQELLRETADDNPIFLLKLGDQSRHTMIKELQSDPISGEMIHVDFLRVSMDEEVTVTVGIELHGTPEGVKNENGMLDFVTREVEVTCLPGNIPGHLDIDVSGLHLGDTISAGNIELPEGVQLHFDEERVICSVHAKAQEAPTETEEAEDEFGDAIEPEVIGKAKDDDGADEA